MPNIRLSVTVAALTSILLIGFGTWLFHELEPWTWAQSFYFTVATLTTVGYGDVHPSNDDTRIAAALFILIGVGVFIASLTKLGSLYLSSQERRISENVARRVRNRKK